MKTFFAAAVAAFTLASPAYAQGKLNVVTATEDLASIAREVGGDKITVESIARGYQDPHFVEAKPSFILKLQKADLLVVVFLIPWTEFATGKSDTLQCATRSN